MTLTIRNARADDLPTIVEFNRLLAWESEHKELDSGILTKGVAALLADRHKGFYTMAEHGGEVVGQILITYEWSDWRNGWYWWIQSVYVRNDARRHGVFRAIYRHLEAAATADPEVIGLRLYVEHDNLNAKATYSKMGMEAEPYSLMGVYPLPGKDRHF